MSTGRGCITTWTERVWSWLPYLSDFSTSDYRFNNYVDHILPNFDLPPPLSGQKRTFYKCTIYPLSRDPPVTFHWPPPPSSCPRSYWMTPYGSAKMLFLPKSASLNLTHVVPPFSYFCPLKPVKLHFLTKTPSLLLPMKSLKYRNRKMFPSKWSRCLIRVLSIAHFSWVFSGRWSFFLQVTKKV